MEKDTDRKSKRIDAGVSRGKVLEVTVDGKIVRAYQGETIAAVLSASGIRAVRRAPQHRDPRGVYCAVGACHGCLVTVNGRPNVRACVTPVEPGQAVSLQDGFGRFDGGGPEPLPGELVSRSVPVLVIGGGPAGLCAALEAADQGAEVLVIDENPQPGGQIYRQMPIPFAIKDPDDFGSDYTAGQALLRRAGERAERITIWNDAVVWGVFDPRQVAVMRNDRLVLITAHAVVVATGAYERPYPVNGWTLPGVMTVGGAQAVIKSQRIRPGERVLLAGTGPLQLVVADQMLAAGIEVVAVAEAAPARFPLGRLLDLLSRTDLLKQGLGYLFRLRKAGVSLLPSHVLKAVEGKDGVEGAVVCRVDPRLHPVAGSEKRFGVDTVCIGYGLIPDIRVTRMLGCTHAYRPLVGGWVPWVDETMQTDQAGVFVAGDGAGVAGVLVARCQGAIAGLYAASHCDLISPDQAERAARPFRKEMGSLLRFRNAMDRMYPVRPGLYMHITDDTLVCRCEGVSAGEIRKAIREGTTDPNDIKKRTRAGMGYCQGMNCLPTIAAMLTREFGVAPEKIPVLTPRPPSKPLPLNLLMVDGGSE